MSTITGTISTQIQLQNIGISGLSSPTEVVINASNLPTWSVSAGTGANQLDLVFSDQRTLSATSSEELDLAGGLTDSFGTTLTFARIKYLYVYSASANGGLIQVGGAATNAFVNWVANSSDILQVRPDGAFTLSAPGATGYAVTGGAGDLLKIANTDSSEATYDIVIAGTSA